MLRIRLSCSLDVMSIGGHVYWRSCSLAAMSFGGRAVDSRVYFLSCPWQSCPLAVVSNCSDVYGLSCVWVVLSLAVKSLGGGGGSIVICRQRRFKSNTYMKELMLLEHTLTNFEDRTGRLSYGIALCIRYLRL